MRAGPRERMITIMAGAGLEAILFFSWLDTALYANRRNHLNGGPICRFLAI
jgi:hypothetical protein